MYPLVEFMVDATGTHVYFLAPHDGLKTHVMDVTLKCTAGAARPRQHHATLELWLWLDAGARAHLRAGTPGRD